MMIGASLTGVTVIWTVLLSVESWPSEAVKTTEESPKKSGFGVNVALLPAMVIVMFSAAVWVNVNGAFSGSLIWRLHSPVPLKSSGGVTVSKEPFNEHVAFSSPVTVYVIGSFST